MLRIYRQLTTLLFKAWVPFKWNLNWIFPRLSHIHPLITYLERGHVVTTTPTKGGGDLVYTISRNIDWIVHRNLLIPCKTRWIHINASQNVNKFHKTGCWQHSRGSLNNDYKLDRWIAEEERKKRKKGRKKKKRKIYKVIVANSKKRDSFAQANNSIVFFHEQFLFQRILFQPTSKRKKKRKKIYHVANRIVTHCNFKRNVALISWQKEN